MATNKKQVGTYATAGVIIAVLMIAAIFASGILPNQKMGTLRVSITDAPVELKKLDVTINGLYVNSKDSDSWTPLNFVDNKLEVNFDLLTLNNVIMDLSLQQIPAGSYSKIRLDVVKAEATFMDDTTAELKVPPGHIDIIISFEIKADQETSLLIDMQPDTVAISNSNNFKPIIKATVE